MDGSAIIELVAGVGAPFALVWYLLKRQEKQCKIDREREQQDKAEMLAREARLGERIDNLVDEDKDNFRKLVTQTTEVITRNNTAVRRMAVAVERVVGNLERVTGQRLCNTEESMYPHPVRDDARGMPIVETPSGETTETTTRRKPAHAALKRHGP